MFQRQGLRLHFGNREALSRDIGLIPEIGVQSQSQKAPDRSKAFAGKRGKRKVKKKVKKGVKGQKKFLPKRQQRKPGVYHPETKNQNKNKTSHYPIITNSLPTVVIVVKSAARRKTPP